MSKIKCCFCCTPCLFLIRKQDEEWLYVWDTNNLTI
jgi:late competence protein required for DNA uptake (superfamily II DNA/RNA helicase)